ncbi:cation:proton antiporter [Sulfurimicrobium lacus]|uniref:cation:proton antiporter n=1 Tax=Sulfurimicrobium lacus TaxID=2715678 RepID=UPI001564A583|nr:cation:proton antiporter [Sulfurimicrobium lacus]
MSATAAVSVHAAENLLFFTLMQLVLILLAARLGGSLALRLGQARVVGEIVVGLLLGPSLFGALAPDTFHYVFHSVSAAPVTIMSQIGLILLMFQIGLDFDFSHLKEKENSRAVLLVAALGLAAPFVLGLAVGHLSHDTLAPEVNPLGYSLFLATALSITAVPILGRIMMEFGLTRTPMGVITITSAAINDVVGWITLAAVTALTLSSFSLSGMLLNLGLLALYAAFCWWALRPLLRWMLARFASHSDNLPQSLMAILLAVIFLSAMSTYKMGIFAIFGGFILGVLLHDEPDFVAAWKAKISDFVTVFFLPIFFTYTGLRTNIGALDSWALWQWCLVILAAATLGKFGGCYLGARWAGRGASESRIIAVMMNTRALMELIVINVGYDLGVIPASVFTMLVIMAVVSTLVTAPALRLWLPKLKPELVQEAS